MPASGVALEPCQFVTEAHAAFDQLCGQPVAHLVHVSGRTPEQTCCVHAAALMLLSRMLGVFVHEETLPHYHLA